VNRNVSWLSFLLAFIAGALAVWGSMGPSARGTVVNPASWDDSASSVPITSADPIWGSRFAPVTLVLFSDYQCPHCKNLEATIEALKVAYGPQKLRVVFKHAPIVHKNARVGHEAAAKVYIAAGSDAYWRFHARAFENSASLTPESFAAWAREAGVDPAVLEDEAIKQRAADKVGADLTLARQLGVRGTPATFVNGQLLSGNQPLDAFKSVIDAELRAAQALASSGTAAGQVYVTRSLKNRPKLADAAASPSSAASAGPAAPDAPPDADAAEAPKDRGKLQEDDPTAYRVPLGKSPARGPASSLVTIVEFGNFECRFSSQVDATLRELGASYKDKVRLVFKHRPLPYLRRGTAASLLAELARADKGDAGFWAAHDALFEAERASFERGEKDPFREASLLAIAAKLGLDEAKVKPLLTDADPTTPTFDPPPEARAALGAIEADADLADDLDAEATPHFFINGRRLVGAQSMDKLQAIVDEELKKAEALVQAGTAAEAVYDVTMKSAKEVPLPTTKLIDPAPKGAPSAGKEAAKVELHIFSDFECPFCKQVTPTLALIKERFSDKVRFVWRDRPGEGHALGKVAAHAAREALAQKGDAGFWAFHDELFTLAKTPDFTREGFEKAAEKQGLDVSALRSALDAGKHGPAIDADLQAAAAAGISGTPSFVVTYATKEGKLEGFFQSGALPPSKFRKLVKLALAIAEGKRPPPATP
jgi:protein-disulfide isomerase